MVVRVRKVVRVMIVRVEKSREMLFRVDVWGEDVERRLGIAWVDEREVMESETILAEDELTMKEAEL